MDMHRPFGFDWGEWVAIFTLIGVVATYIRSSVSRTAQDSSRGEFQKLSEVNEGLKETMIKVNITLDTIKRDHEKESHQLEIMQQEIMQHREWLSNDHLRLKNLEEEDK